MACANDGGVRSKLQGRVPSLIREQPTRHVPLEFDGLTVWNVDLDSMEIVDFGYAPLLVPAPPPTYSFAPATAAIGPLSAAPPGLQFRIARLILLRGSPAKLRFDHGS
jgi:hypothetical protein